MSLPVCTMSGVTWADWARDGSAYPHKAEARIRVVERAGTLRILSILPRRVGCSIWLKRLRRCVRGTVSQSSIIQRLSGTTTHADEGCAPRVACAGARMRCENSVVADWNGKRKQSKELAENTCK